MRHFTKSDQCAVLALLLVLTGCTLPAGGHRDGAAVGGPTSVVTPVNPNQTGVPSVSAASSSSPPVQTALAGCVPGPCQRQGRAADALRGTGSAARIRASGFDPGEAGSGSVSARSPRAIQRRCADGLSSRRSVRSVQRPGRIVRGATGGGGAGPQSVAPGRFGRMAGRSRALPASGFARRSDVHLHDYAPNGVGTDNGGGWMVQASQKIPWAGKRALRGSAASAEADAMQGRHRRCPAAAVGSGQDGILRLLPGPAGDWR